MAVNHCGEVNPITWLGENWSNMIDTVMTLASNVGHEAEENTTGTISKAEARDALRKHKGNIWASVTECVEGRQQKYDDLQSKGNFTREDIVTMLTAHEGNVEAAFQVQSSFKASTYVSLCALLLHHLLHNLSLKLPRNASSKIRRKVLKPILLGIEQSSTEALPYEDMGPAREEGRRAEERRGGRR